MFDTRKNIENCTDVEYNSVINKHVNRESKILISQFSCTDVINMKLLEVVTPPFIYHCCSTRKTLWEENFTPVSMKINVFEMLGNTGRLWMERSTSPWKPIWIPSLIWHTRQINPGYYHFSLLYLPISGFLFSILLYR